MPIQNYHSSHGDENLEAFWEFVHRSCSGFGEPAVRLQKLIIPRGLIQAE
jgi:hypothetical protein